DDRQCHDVQGKEAVEGGTGDQVVTTHPHQQVFADDGNCPHQRHDHVGTPVGHLAPGQYVAHEALDDQHQVDGHAEYPDQLTWLLVGTVHQPAEHVQVDDDEEGRGPGGVQIAQQPAPFHVAHDVLDRGEGAFGAVGVVHGQPDTGQQLHDQNDQGQNTKEIPEVEVLGSVVLAHVPFPRGDDRQTVVGPVSQAGQRGNDPATLFRCAHYAFTPSSPITITLSVS